MKILSVTTCVFALTILVSCDPPVTNYTEKVIEEDPSMGASRAAEILAATPMELADGLTVSLWASDSLAPDPVAMSIDDYGKIYMTRTNRQKNSEFDIRGHQDWMTASIGLQSVEDRRAFLRATFAPEKSEQNAWLKDLNNDGIHDWHDLTVEKDEVWRLEDINGDGIADISTRVLDDFNDEISDVAGAMLVRRNDLFVGIGPDMWRVTDADGDGKLDTKVSISHGYAVHIGFGAHGMSGAIEGPDGKIYWGIGDIGANLTALNGDRFVYPNQGVLVRSNPDGSDFEVFAAGLRNTHEFVFDEYGNIIGADNDGDHPGESERLVYIVEGSDAGWRSNWQYGKYTDPKNNSYKVWMDEKLYVPRWEGQAAYIIPPIINYHNGPTGMAYNPGTALGSRWKNKFFLVEFVGTPSASPIWSFSLKPSGASFVLDQEEKILKGILPTAIRFGPDGALYAADWINGWSTKNYGRVWRIDVTEDQNNLAEEREKTKALMALDYQSQSESDLYDLLFYPDMRIRQKAQFELVRKGKPSVDDFKNAVNQKENQLARIHGIWGMGQLISARKMDASALSALLQDADQEIVAQAAKVLGEQRFSESGQQLIPLLGSSNDRVKFFAAQALGRMEYEPALPALLDMLEQNNDKDLYVRHAGVLALSRIGNVEAMMQLENHPEKSMRTAAVLVLRRLRNPGLSVFLDDEDVYIVTEAARGINDDWSVDASLPDLANVLSTKQTSEPLLRRAINAASRVGGNQEIDLLIGFSSRMDVAPPLRAEALAVLGSWSSPSVLDRVDGRYRGEVSRDASYVIEQLMPHITEYLHDENEEVIIAATQLVAAMGIEDFVDEQYVLFQTHASPQVRAASMHALDALDFAEINAVIELGMNDESSEVRTAAVGLIASMNTDSENLQEIIAPIFKKGSIREQQQLLAVLGEMSLEETEELFVGFIDLWEKGDLEAGIKLDLVEAIDSTKSGRLIEMIAAYRPSGDNLEDYSDVLFGGNRRSGARVVWGNPAGQCLRCHTWEPTEGSVGPTFQGMGNRLTREQLLEALIEPSARLAPGYGTVKLLLKDGNEVSGTLLEETAGELLLKTVNPEPLEIAKERIESRENVMSNMPPMGNVLTRRELRDVIEFLSSLEE